MMDVPPGIDPGQRIIGANDGRDPQHSGHHLSLKFLDAYPEAVSLVVRPDRRVLGIEPEVIERMITEILILDPGKAIRKPDHVVPIVPGLPPRSIDIGTDEKTAPLVEKILAHQIPGPRHMVLGETPDVIAEVFVFPVIGGGV
jgi:hypothetical protein